MDEQTAQHDRADEPMTVPGYRTIRLQHNRLALTIRAILCVKYGAEP
jgi:hypothetical protein